MFILACYIPLYLIILLIFSIIWWYITVPPNLPPGPKGLPFIGSALKTWKVSTLPANLNKWKTQFGDIYKLYVGNNLIIVLGTWDLIHEALVKQGDIYAGRAEVNHHLPKELAGLGLINSEGELWKTQRRFAFYTLRDFGFGKPILEQQIRQESEYLIDAISAHKGDPFDPAPLLESAIANVICGLVFGRRFEYNDQNLHYMLELMRSRLKDTDISPLAPVLLSSGRMTKLFHIIPEVRYFFWSSNQLAKFFRLQTLRTLQDFSLDQGDEPTNYIQAFYKAQQGENNWTFTHEQLVASVGNLFNAGTHTTAATMRWAVFYMAYFPQVQENIYEEIKENVSENLSYADRVKLPYTEATIMEIQRMANILPTGLLRRTLAPSRLAGYDIPVGTLILPLLESALWDPIVYPNPHIFDPNRFLQKRNSGEKLEQLTHLIPFQAGKRVCLGESLAKMELFIFLTSLISRFKFYFPRDQPAPSLYPTVSLIRGPQSYKICAESRAY